MLGFAALNPTYVTADLQTFVIPAQAGIQIFTANTYTRAILDPRLRGDDGVVVGSAVIPACAGMMV